MREAKAYVGRSVLKRFKIDDRGRYQFFKGTCKEIVKFEGEICYHLGKRDEGFRSLGTVSTLDHSAPTASAPDPTSAASRLQSLRAGPHCRVRGRGYGGHPVAGLLRSAPAAAREPAGTAFAGPESPLRRCVVGSGFRGAVAVAGAPSLATHSSERTSSKRLRHLHLPVGLSDATNRLSVPLGNTGRMSTDKPTSTKRQRPIKAGARIGAIGIIPTYGNTAFPARANMCRGVPRAWLEPPRTPHETWKPVRENVPVHTLPLQSRLPACNPVMTAICR